MAQMSGSNLIKKYLNSGPITGFLATLSAIVVHVSAPSHARTVQRVVHRRERADNNVHVSTGNKQNQNQKGPNEKAFIKWSNYNQCFSCPSQSVPTS